MVGRILCARQHSVIEWMAAKAEASSRLAPALECLSAQTFGWRGDLAEQINSIGTRARTWDL